MMLCVSMLNTWADDSGTIGDCTWYFEEATGTLTISGNGATGDHDYLTSPWKNYSEAINKIIAEEGVTRVGGGVIYMMPNLTTVELSSTVVQLGDWDLFQGPFYGCDNLTTIYLHGCVIGFPFQELESQGVTVICEDGAGYADVYIGMDDDYLNTDEQMLSKEVLPEDRQLIIPICIKNNNVDVSQIQFDIRLPKGFNLATDENGKKKVEMDKVRFDYDEDFGYSHTLTLGALGADDISTIYRIVLSSSDNTPIKGDDGEAVYITLRLDDDLDMRDGDYYLWQSPSGFNIGNIELSTPSANRVLPMEKWKNFKVYLREPGDFYKDGNVSVTDYAGVVKYVAGQGYDEEVPEWVITKVSDVNEDGVVTVTDVSGVVNIILYGNYKGNSANARARRAAKEIGAALSIRPFTISQGETKEITVDLSSAYADLSQCQFDLTLPEGLSLATVNGRPAVYPGELTRLGDGFSHTVSCAQREDGTVRVVCLSGSNEAYNGTEGSIVRMKITADKDMAAGATDIELGNVEFARTDASMVLGAGSIASVTVDNETDGITSVSDSSMEQKSVYTVDGMRKEKLSKGLNIVRRSDGSIQKVLVK